MRQVFCVVTFRRNDECGTVPSLALYFDPFLENGLGPAFAFRHVGGVFSAFNDVTEEVTIIPAGRFMVNREDQAKQGGSVFMVILMDDVPAGAAAVLGIVASFCIVSALLTQFLPGQSVTARPADPFLRHASAPDTDAVHLAG